ACGAPIAWHDNIPVLSWLILRGRARCCGRPFSARYPFVELLTAALFLACWLRMPPAQAVCGWVFLASLICGTFIALDHMIIPDGFTVGLAVEGILLSALVPALHGHHGGPFALASLRSVSDSLAGLVAGSGVVLWIALIAEAVLKKEAMGFGDVKFVGAIGAFCGWHGAVFSVFGGAAVGTVWLGTAPARQKISGRRGGGAPRARPRRPRRRSGAPRSRPSRTRGRRRGSRAPRCCSRTRCASCGGRQGEACRRVRCRPSAGPGSPARPSRSRRSRGARACRPPATASSRPPPGPPRSRPRGV